MVSSTLSPFKFTVRVPARSVAWQFIIRRSDEPWAPNDAPVSSRGLPRHLTCQAKYVCSRWTKWVAQGAPLGYSLDHLKAELESVLSRFPGHRYYLNWRA